MFILRLMIFTFALVGANATDAVTVNTDLLSAYAKPSQYMDIKISPTGEYLASTSRNDEGTVSLTVLDLKNDKIVSITRGKGKESVNSFDWLNDERLLLTMAREFGSFEAPFPTGELIAMDADGGNKVILTGRRAKSGDKRFSAIIDVLPDQPEQVLIYSVDRTAEEPFLDLYRMKVSNGRKKSLGRAPLRAFAGGGVQIIANDNGDVLVIQGSDPTKDNMSIMMARETIDADWKVVLETKAYQGDFNPIKFLEDGETLIGMSDLKTDTRSIATFNIKTKEHTVLLNHNKADMNPVMSVSNGEADEIVAGSYEFNEIGISFLGNVKNTKNQAFIASLMKTFKDQSVTMTSATKDDGKFVIRVSSANKPGKFYLYDNEVRKLKVLTPSRPWLKTDMIPTTQIVTYTSRDNKTITGVLTLPPGKSKNLPFILLPHGGPHGIKDTILNMDADAKVFASHGYAVLQPNFRGSGGYGKAFLTAGFRKWGTEMIDDMTDGTNFLIKEGIVDKDRMCVYGASYGGYAAIQSVIREPDLYKCTVGFVGVYDLDMMFEKGDIQENQSGVNYMKRVLPTGEDVKVQSPVLNADKIKVPVFIIQGEEDVRVPKEHAFALRDALEARKHPLEWMMKKGEGHGFYKPENNIERWEAMLKFFNKHMGES
jgi:dipeptidyl aminopeptidase/acylaminoacyl peptidase